jgi:hypothetical protein
MPAYLELRTTISPGPSFYRRIHYLAASIARFGGRLKDFEIVVSVGGNEPRENLYRTQSWSKLYPIIWRWVNPDDYARLGYRATNRDRAWHMSRARHVMIVDSDVIFMTDFSDLLLQIENSPAVCGVMAHFPPFGSKSGVNPFAWWERLFREIGLSPPSHMFELSGWKISGNNDYRYSPAYFNGGMVVAPVELMEELFAFLPEADDALAVVGEFRHKAQIARTLAMYKAGVAFRTLPMRYNFPNDLFFDKAYPDEVNQLRILHYLRRDIVDRARDFESPAAIRQLVVRTDLVGTNEKLRKLIAVLEARVANEEGLRDKAFESPRPVPRYYDQLARKPGAMIRWLFRSLGRW